MAGAAKVKADPFAPVRDKILRLTTHLERSKQRMNSGFVPARYASKAAAYKEWLALEVRRTSDKLENLKLALPAAK